MLNSLCTNSSLDTSSSSCISDKFFNQFEAKTVKTNNLFTVNEQVKLIVDFELFEKIQEESHGGWNKKMIEIIGKTVRVHRITEKGDIRIKFETDTNIRWTIYTFLLNKKELNFEIGEKVLVNKDERVFKNVLKDDWTDKFRKFIGQICKVEDIRPNGDLLLSLNNQELSIPRQLCYKINDKISDDNCLGFNNLEESTLIEDMKKIGFDQQKMENQNLEQINITDYFVKKCSNGNLKKVIDILEKYPNVINERSFGKTGLQVSSYQGHKEIVEYLLKSGAKNDKTDSDGDTALHYACFGNQPIIIEILLKYNANINFLNKNCCSPLHVSVNKQHVQCVILLVKHGCNINIQDSYGDTPLHDIIGKKMTSEAIQIINFLLHDKTLNLGLTNKRGFNLFHQACLKGNDLVAEILINLFPELIDLQKNDGYSALHLASLNGHKKIIEFLIKAKADLEVRTNRNQTALLLAIAKFNIPIIEILVENYANVNTYDEDMDTCLHLVLNESAFDKNSNKIISPAKIKLNNLQISLECLSESESVSEVLEILPYDLKSNIRVIIASYLIKNGANLYAKNKYGLTCLDFIKDKFVKNFLIEYYASLQSDWGFEKISLDSKSNEIERCKLCDEEPISVTFLPCNHKCVCFDCSIRIKKCIECHRIIVEKVDFNGTSLNLTKTEFSELIEKVKNMEEAQLCPICMERKKDTTFQCGHTACAFCSKHLVSCHICRETIFNKIKIYEN